MLNRIGIVGSGFCKTETSIVSSDGGCFRCYGRWGLDIVCLRCGRGSGYRWCLRRCRLLCRGRSHLDSSLVVAVLSISKGLAPHVVRFEFENQYRWHYYFLLFFSILTSLQMIAANTWPRGSHAVLLTYPCHDERMSSPAPQQRSAELSCAHVARVSSLLLQPPRQPLDPLAKSSSRRGMTCGLQGSGVEGVYATRRNDFSLFSIQ